MAEKQQKADIAKKSLKILGRMPNWTSAGPGNISSNYRPIIFLPLMWKLLTGVIVDQIYREVVTRKTERMQEKIQSNQ